MFRITEGICEKYRVHPSLSALSGRLRIVNVYSAVLRSASYCPAVQTTSTGFLVQPDMIQANTIDINAVFFM